MRRLLKWIIVLAVLCGLGYAAYRPAAAWWAARNKITFRTEKVSKGDISAYVNSTGEIKPVRSVQVGAFVSGPIIELLVDFNDRVTEGQLLAEIDPKLPRAAFERERATLATRNAEVERVKAQLQQAVNDETRAKELRDENKDFISQAELDRLYYARLGLEAQLKVADAQILQAQAGLENAEANLEYTKITAPVDGIIIDRKIDEGQTVASGFQTPELFTIAPQMEERMHVFASVDEADIGLIRQAKKAGRPVEFTVDAYPEDTFEGTIDQIRFSSTTTQNVVTYPVVVAAPNLDLKLLPGMTADLSFLVEKRVDLIRVPNAALRFLPDAKMVHPDDKKVLFGDDGSEGDDEEPATEADESEKSEDEAASTDDSDVSGEDEASSSSDSSDRKKRDRVRHVWYKDGELLRAIAVKTGLTSSQYTEVVEGDLEDGQELVVGTQQ